MTLKEITIRLKPAIPKRHLLMVASFVWLCASGMLLWRGIIGVPHGGWQLWEIVASLIGGLFFFRVLFFRISSKHILRISSLEILRPCVFSFFNFRSYILMALMITLGISVRKFHLISAEFLSYFYITMATPLLFSAVRFFLAWCRYRELLASL
jgi:hypothetical protein